MRKLRNTLRLGLFITGITLQFASFGVSQVEQAPWVLNIVSPKSVSGMAGVVILTTEKPLEQNDKGFREISDIVKTRLKKFNPNKDWDKVDVIRYVTEGKKSITGLGIDLVSVSVRVFFSNNKESKIGTDDLAADFEKMRKRSIFHWSLGLLIVGVGIVQIPLFFIQSESGEKDKQKQ